MRACPQSAETRCLVWRAAGCSLQFLGIDAAWGSTNETGAVALDQTGRITAAGWPVGLQQTLTWIGDNTDDDCLVFIDAPLVVTNSSGQRLCETQVGQRYWKAMVFANSTNTNSKYLGGVVLRENLEEMGFRYDDGLDGPPKRGRVVSECFPYTTIVGYEPFGYDERPRYKRQPKGMRTAEFAPLRAQACDDLITRVSNLALAEPPMDLRSHALTRALLDEPSPHANRAYKHREDLLDAALCAWTAALWHRFGHDCCQVLGERQGVDRPAPTIIAPAKPSQRARS